MVAASKVLLALAYLAGGKAQAPAADVAFEQFLRDFGKEYDEAEKKVHFLTFAKNYDYITEENAKNHSYKLGLNAFSDMPISEFKASKLGLSGSPWAGLESLGVHEASDAAPPKTVDWRTKNAVTEVKDQKSCGSCWAFSSTGSLEGAWAIATGKLVPLSEQQLVDCASKFGNQGCSGGLMDNAFKYEEQAAVCTEESYGYKAIGGTCKVAGCTVGIPKGAVVGFKDVKADDENALMDAVSKNPVSVAIEADEMAFQLYKSGVLTKTCGDKLDHGVLVVGYGNEDGKDYWLVKNSWGPSWGEQGYIKIERGHPGAGECGIKDQASYPVVKSMPSPPAPPPAPPAPPSPPAPSTSHYEAPPCQDDEVQASVEGAGGSVCAPSCSDSSCPTDVPAGTTAKPSCVLEDASSGEKYCALACHKGGCPEGAKCAKIGGPMRICVYPEQENGLLLRVAFDSTVINI